MNSLAILALAAGSCIAFQAAMNAKLGLLLNNSWLATSYAFLTSFLLVSAVLFLVSVKATTDNLGSISELNIPWYLWFSSVLSVLGVGSMYWLIPRMGVGNMMSYALAGQLIVAMLISHYGLFDSPQKLISGSKALGSALLILAIVLINKE